MAMPMGTVKARAAVPAVTRMRRISSVAYATEERASDANTASAVGLERRSCRAWAVGSGRPTNTFLSVLMFTRRLPKALAARRARPATCSRTRSRRSNAHSRRSRQFSDTLSGGWAPGSPAVATRSVVESSARATERGSPPRGSASNGRLVVGSPVPPDVDPARRRYATPCLSGPQHLVPGAEGLLRWREPPGAERGPSGGTGENNVSIVVPDIAISRDMRTSRSSRRMDTWA